MPISNFSSQRNLNRMLLKNNRVYEKTVVIVSAIMYRFGKNVLFQDLKLQLSGNSLLFLRFYAK